MYVIPLFLLSIAGGRLELFLAFFYTKEELGLRLALWFGFATVAGAFGGLIAFGVQHIHSSVQNWRLLFIIEVRPFFQLIVFGCSL